MLSKSLFVSILAGLSIMSITPAVSAQYDSTATVETGVVKEVQPEAVYPVPTASDAAIAPLPAQLPAPVSASVPALPVPVANGGSAEISVSTGTELKIIDLNCKKNTDECVLTWKTNITPQAKAKIVFWSGNQPSILDPYFMVNDTTGVFLHKFSLKASELPQKFVKIRLSYIISEDAGAYSDIMAEDIKLEK